MRKQDHVAPLEKNSVDDNILLYHATVGDQREAAYQFLGRGRDGFRMGDQGLAMCWTLRQELHGEAEKIHNRVQAGEQQLTADSLHLVLS